MIHHSSTWAVGAALALSSLALTAQANPLLQANGCTSCHAVNEKVVGPAFQRIAEKYAGDKDAVATLSQSIQNGSRGKWGRVPMPPHPGMSAADIKEVATWVMTQKP